MNTVAEEMDKTRNDVAPGDAGFRWQGAPVTRLHERIRAAQERIRQQNISGQTPAADEQAPLDPNLAQWAKADEASRITHNLGLSNTAASRAFVNRVLALEETIAAQSELLVALNAEVEALKAKRK